MLTVSALTLLVGRQEGHPARKNWGVGCWRGYLSGARCRLAYGPADATDLEIYWIDRSSRSISADVKSIDRVDSSRVDRSNRPSERKVESVDNNDSSWLLAVVQILLSTVNSDHRCNCHYAVVTNTDFDWQIASCAPPAVAELLVIRAAANE